MGTDQPAPDLSSITAIIPEIAQPLKEALDMARSAQAELDQMRRERDDQQVQIDRLVAQLDWLTAQATLPFWQRLFGRRRPPE